MNKKLIAVAQKVADWLQNADLQDPKASDEAVDLANELETAINES
jgi:hypothetical protein